jgi:hypothetical protein
LKEVRAALDLHTWNYLPEAIAPPNIEELKKERAKLLAIKEKVERENKEKEEAKKKQEAEEAALKAQQQAEIKAD